MNRGLFAAERKPTHHTRLRRCCIDTSIGQTSMCRAFATVKCALPLRSRTSRCCVGICTRRNTPSFHLPIDSFSFLDGRTLVETVKVLGWLLLRASLSPPTFQRLGIRCCTYALSTENFLRGNSTPDEYSLYLVLQSHRVMGIRQWLVMHDSLRQA